MMTSQSEQINDFRYDIVLIGLKRVANSGRGEHGPLFDQGVLSVIEQIENTGSFVPNPNSVLAGVPRAIKAKILTPDELTQFGRMAEHLGMTMEQASQFANGIRTAESNLRHYALEVIAQDRV